MIKKPTKPAVGKKRQTGPIDKYFGDRIRARRVMLSMSQEELGGKLGVTFQQVQKYEAGANRVSAATMVSIARILSVDIGYFFDEMQKKTRGGDIETPVLTQVALTSHGRRMIQGFVNLENDQLRGAMADLAQALAASPRKKT